MMLRTGLQQVGNAALEHAEVMELEDMMSPVIFTFIRMQDPQPKNYEETVPLVRKWIDTQQGAYSLKVPEKHAVVTEVAESGDKSSAAKEGGPQESPKTIKHHLKQHEHRVMKKMADKIDALTQQLHSV